MNETYVECLVKAKSSPLMKCLQVLCITLAVLAFFSIMAGTGILGLIVTVLLGVGAYFAGLYVNIEYEYLYLDKELSVDKVIGQSKRKKMATYALSSIESMAPYHSHHLDDYKNRQVKVKDYSIGVEEKPDLRYAVYLENGEKLILSPSEALVKAMRNHAPRKIFTD